MTPTSDAQGIMESMVGIAHDREVVIGIEEKTVTKIERLATAVSAMSAAVEIKNTLCIRPAKSISSASA